MNQYYVIFFLRSRKYFLLKKNTFQHPIHLFNFIVSSRFSLELKKVYKILKRLKLKLIFVFFSQNSFSNVFISSLRFFETQSFVGKQKQCLTFNLSFYCFLIIFICLFGFLFFIHSLLSFAHRHLFFSPCFSSSFQQINRLMIFKWESIQYQIWVKIGFYFLFCFFFLFTFLVHSFYTFKWLIQM